MSNSRKDHNRQGYQRRKQNQPQVQPAQMLLQEQLPVRGMAADDSQLGPAFEILIQRMEGIERELRLAQRSTEALREENSRLRHQVQTDIANEKLRSAQALEAARERWEKMVDQAPPDPATRALLVAEAQRKANEQRAIKTIRFRDNLKSMPTGTIVNNSNKRVPLQINSIVYIINPGKNENIPEPFIKLWEDMEEMTRFAMEREQALRGHHSFGELENIRAGGKSAGVNFVTHTWDEEAGVL